MANQLDSAFLRGEHRILVKRDVQAQGRVLFLSIDGLLQPLGRSQIVAYVRELASRGLRYSIVSAERGDDLADAAGIAEVRASLRERDVEWVPVPYSQGGLPSAAKNLVRLSQAVARLIRHGDIALIHARSYVAAGVALGCKAKLGTPYLFDTRGYWVEEKRAGGRWFQKPLAYRAAKQVERALYANASGVVGLTQLSVDDYRSGVFGGKHSAPAVAIPTATDERAFTFDRSKTPPTSEAHLSRRFTDKLVVGFVGSVNASYRVDESIELFASLRRIRPDVHLLGITRQPEALKEALRKASIHSDDFTVVCAQYADMPKWLSCIDWGLLLLIDGLEKRASMPTKLAEFLACGVRPVHFGCNTEVKDWIAKTGSGITLPNLSSTALRDAASQIARISQAPTNEATRVLLQARNTALGHFGIESSVDRYEALLKELLAGPPS